MSDTARDLLRDLLAEALAGSNGHAPAPVVPPPPVAAVHRPSSWGPPAATAEPVTIETDEDLARFVATLVARCEDPAQREAIRAGGVRFTLLRADAAAPRHATPGSARHHGAGAIRVDRGAVTERKIADAAKAGGRIVLGPRAVLTPLAREKARALGVELEREG